MDEKISNVDTDFFSEDTTKSRNLRKNNYRRCIAEEIDEENCIKSKKAIPFSINNRNNQNCVYENGAANNKNAKNKSEKNMKMNNNDIHVLNTDSSCNIISNTSSNITENNTNIIDSLTTEESCLLIKQVDDNQKYNQKNNNKNINIVGINDQNKSNLKVDLEAAEKLENSQQYRVRVVPIEKLLEKPKIVERKSKRIVGKQTESRVTHRRSCRNNLTIIELSDEDDDDFEDASDSETDVFVPQTKRLNLRKPVQVVQKPTIKKNFIEKRIQNATIKKSISGKHKLKKFVIRLKRVQLPKQTKKPPTEKFSTIINKMNGGNGIARGSSVLVAQSSTTAGGSDSRILRRKEINSSSEDSDFEEINNKTLNDNNSDDEVSTMNKTIEGVEDTETSDSDAHSSDSEVIPVRRKRTFNKRNSESNSDSDFEPNTKQQQQAGKKRRRLKTMSTDDDSDSNGGVGGRKGKRKRGKNNDDSGSDDDDDETKKNKRKHIRKLIKTKDLDISTKTAKKEEEERIKRIEERQKLYNQICEKPDSVEVSELVLDFDDETKEPLLELDKGLLKKLKPHQVAGVKFMWDSCFETLKEATENPGSGCILAHCMGLGKTLQIVSLTHTLVSNSRKTNVERVLIISPLSTLTNWAREFKYWMGFARKRDIEIYDISKYKDKALRIFKLNEWFEEGGVCILGYDMYRILANDKAKGLRKKQKDILQKSLVDPGPDMVVCDEGHLLKNEKTSISKAVTKMKTKRRIVLTGTPLQNNLKEYYCMIQFIKPNLLGTFKEYMNRFVNPITNGQYTDSTDRDIRLMKHRSHILHKMLEGCIQRRDYSVLAPYLPPKHEYVVFTTLSDLQKELYEYYMTVQRDITSSDLSGKGARLFQDFQDLRRIWTHPMNLRVNSDTVIKKRLLANDDDSLESFICDDDEEEENTSSSDGSIDSSKSFASGDDGKKMKPRKTRNSKCDDNDDENDNDSDVELIGNGPQEMQNDPSEWWKRFVDDKELNNINHSPKLVILMRLLEQCEAIGDKLLVFSQSLQSLDVIEHFLSLIDSKTKGKQIEGDVGDFKGYWTPCQDYFRLDGSCSVEQRESMCKKFNDPKNLRSRLFLISTRAGGLGINLVAANRVVIFDVSWNPSHDTQSIFRVYRFGQEKPCYIYRLIAIGTMEQKVYERQVTKQATAKRVIDEQQISRHYNQSDLQELYTYELMPTTEREIPILPKDRLFAELLSEHEKLLFKYHEHDSLLENEESENLNEAERKAAWDEYEAEKTRSVQTSQYVSYERNAYANLYGNASGSVTSNKVFGFRSDVLLQLLNMKVAKDHPDMPRTTITQLVPEYLQRLYNQMNNGDPTIYRDLLALHQTLIHPSGMYMNPLLYANQNPSAAGYYQAPGTAGAAASTATSGTADAGQQPAATGQPQKQNAEQGKGFDPNQVYEID